MKENDATQFLKSAHKGFVDFLSEGVFELIPRSIVPEEENIFPAVCTMYQNQRVKTREIYRYKD